jgi:hypothetical protein
LNAFAGLLAALVVSGCPEDVLLELRSVWTLDSNALLPIKGGKTGKKGKSKAASSSEGEGRLCALLVIRSAVRGEVEEGVVEDLKAAVKEESASEELDIAIVSLAGEMGRVRLKRSVDSCSLCQPKSCLNRASSMPY